MSVVCACVHWSMADIALWLVQYLDIALCRGGWPRLRKYPNSRKRTVQASAKEQMSAVVKSQFSLRSNFLTEGLRDRLPSFLKISSTFGGVLSC